jgi:hypothetical protein
VPSWSGSSVSVSGGANGAIFTRERAWRRAAAVEDALDASGLAAELVEAALVEVEAVPEDDWLTLELWAVEPAPAPLDLACVAREGARVATRWWWTR